MGLTAELQTFLDKGRLSLMRTRNTAFYAHILLQMQEVIDDPHVKTAAVDGKRIYFNSGFLESLNNDVNKLQFLIMHEILHIVFQHMLPVRRSGRDPKLWNMAGDYVINLELYEAGFKFIDGGLLDQRFAGMSTEEVYEILESEGAKGKPDHSDLIESGSGNEDNDDGSGSGQGEQDEESKGTKAGRASVTEQEIKDLVTGAYTAHVMAKGDPGSIPGSVRRMVDNWLNPTLPWQSILARWMNEVSNDDFSWRKLNKRFLSHDIYLPGMVGDGLSRIDFAIDVSGSISDSEFRLFTSEVAGVLTQLTPKEIGVMQFDSYNLSNDVVHTLEDLRMIEYKGGGGTDLKDTLRVFKQSPAEALIIFTDGYLSTELEPPTRPVIWCVYDNPSFIPPFGQITHFNLSDLKSK